MSLSKRRTMSKSRSRIGIGIALLAWAVGMLIGGTSRATLPISKKAKELGYKVENCLYCHNEKLPKKGAATHNERGKWLIAEKEKRGAKEVDPAWLKDYPGDK
jgi:hypothetical protein